MVIAITLPHLFNGEPEAITERLLSGIEGFGAIDVVHVRKPGSQAADVERLICAIPQHLRHRLTLHDHFQLAAPHGIGGLHLNSRCPAPPEGWSGRLSCSCHSLSELSLRKSETLPDGTPRFTYLSLSPIFDSISKQGYLSAFGHDELLQAHLDGIIDSRVMALGGISPSNISEALALGFGGVMVLGSAWKGI